MNSADIDRLVQEITDEVLTILEGNCPVSSGHAQGAALRDVHSQPHSQKDEVEKLIQLGAARVGTKPGVEGIHKDLASYIDHTLLSADTTPDKIEKLCAEAIQYHFFSVCINSSYVKYCSDLVAKTGVKVCSVVGFPLGAMSTPGKVYEAQVAEYDGSQEIDMVIHIGALKSKAYDYVERDISSIVKGVSKDTLVKVIIETAFLTDEEKIIACELAKKANAHFVKTSTGFGPGGATAADVALMRQVVGESMGVKASGGIRDRKTAELMIQAGASRIGASASVKIVGG